MFNTELFFNSVPILASAAVVTFKLFVCCVCLSLMFGTLSVMLQLSNNRCGYWLSRTYVSIMRGTPLLVQLFVVFFITSSRGTLYMSAIFWAMMAMYALSLRLPRKGAGAR